MNIILYDGSFRGFLTAVFEIYEYKIEDPAIYKNGYGNSSLFSAAHLVQTNDNKSKRVYKRLYDKLSKNGVERLYPAFLSELTGIEDSLFRYIQYVMASKDGGENDFSNADVLTVLQVSKKVHREKYRMEAFVRFQLTRDQLFYSIIQPDFNVLPLISKHFETRYADQRWLIYDGLRKYGLFYNLQQVSEVEITFEPIPNDDEKATFLYDDKEALYQQLWQQYFKSVNIAARKNMKLHIQHMPKRYWKYLIEKQ